MYSAVGGVETHVRSVAEGCADRGHAVTALTARDRGPGRTAVSEGVTVHEVATLGSVQSVPVAPTFPLLLERLATRADVLHYHLPNPLATVSHLLARPSTPAVATFHSDVVRQSWALAAYDPVRRRFLDAMDRVVVTSPPLLAETPCLDRVRERCTVVPLSVDLDALGAGERGSEASADAPSLPGGPGRRVLTVGRLNYYKGVEVLVEAMASVDGTLLVVGDGPRRAALVDRADRLGIADRVHFLGRVSDDRLRDCYAGADVFVLPSVARSEAFGIVQLEAMAHGLPVVNTDLPTGVPWVSRDGETGLTVPPGDPDRLADAVARLLADPALRERYGRAARRRVADRFGRERMLDDLLAVYRDVTGRLDERLGDGP